jgi:hypothetical protein
MASLLNREEGGFIGDLGGSHTFLSV